MRDRLIRQFSKRDAFTMVELLVVIAIIAVLAILALAVTGSVRKLTDRTKCLTNLRTVGSAMASYIGDHNGYFPGPLWEWQSCWYNEDDYGALGTVLGPYLSAPANSENRKLDLLVCPAWQRGAPYRDDESFLMNFYVDLNGGKINPFGDADLSESEFNSDDPATPKLMARLSGVNLARTWVMQDLDALSVPGGDPRRIAPKPVHGDKRNALFLDFHAESVPLDFSP